MRTKT